MSEQLNLFAQGDKIPLAEKMRPQKLSEILGQEEIIGNNSLLVKMLEKDRYSSFILWGPPGSGKTTIAKIIATNSQRKFISLSAVFSKIADIKQIMQDAEHKFLGGLSSTILFIDEIHRFNKSQQDAFLPYVESGAIILIGATTENPSFEIISALLSRCHVFVLQKIDETCLNKILIDACRKFYPEQNFKQEVLNFIALQAQGDARKALNFLELLTESATEYTTVEEVGKILSQKTMFYDKNREEHYNLISALHKSLRGSDANAGLYWLARMLEAGEDPLYITRRLVRFASEDVGLSDPNALVQAIAVKEAVHFLGMPEANTALAQLVVYLATAPKSNAVYMAYKKAALAARETSHFGAPFHIRNAPTKLMKELGYGKDYVYSHDTENHYHYQKYFPDKMEEATYYEPSPFGFEKEIDKRLKWWQKLKEEQKT